MQHLHVRTRWHSACENNISTTQRFHWLERYASFPFSPSTRLGQGHIKSRTSSGTSLIADHCRKSFGKHASRIHGKWSPAPVWVFWIRFFYTHGYRNSFRQHFGIHVGIVNPLVIANMFLSACMYLYVFADGLWISHGRRESRVHGCCHGSPTDFLSLCLKGVVGGAVESGVCTRYIRPASAAHVRLGWGSAIGWGLSHDQSGATSEISFLCCAHSQYLFANLLDRNYPFRVTTATLSGEKMPRFSEDGGESGCARTFGWYFLGLTNVGLHCCDRIRTAIGSMTCMHREFVITLGQPPCTK